MTLGRTEKQRYEKRRWYVYGGSLILFVLPTVAEVMFYYEPGLALLIYIASSMTICGGVLAWCIYDSLARGFYLSAVYKLWIVLLGPVIVPAYFFQSRGVRESAKSLFGLSLYAPFFAVYYATWFLTAEVLTRMGYFSPA
ncbi:MAG: hypothetical protein IH944_01185 [Armatimonadetes bacterium]|nr:hypothetical protein [Armatimonadota bacterium]